MTHRKWGTQTDIGYPLVTCNKNLVSTVYMSICFNFHDGNNRNPPIVKSLRGSTLFCVRLNSDKQDEMLKGISVQVWLFLASLIIPGRTRRSPQSTIQPRRQIRGPFVLDGRLEEDSSRRPTARRQSGWGQQLQNGIDDKWIERVGEDLRKYQVWIKSIIKEAI